jgi:hypothetical protein
LIGKSGSRKEWSNPQPYEKRDRVLRACLGEDGSPGSRGPFEQWHQARQGRPPSASWFVDMIRSNTSNCNAISLAHAWAAHSRELALWAWATLVNRVDVWGGYRPLDEVGKEYIRQDGTKGKLGPQTTRPANRSRRGKDFLTQAILARHFAGRCRQDIVGLHSTSEVNTSRCGAVDIDYHGSQSTAPEVNQAAAIGWYAKLVSLGLVPLLTDSNGAGGFHLLAIFADPVATERVFAFARWLVSDHARFGLPAPPETFPKQAQIQPGRYGNWLRLPGPHHTKDHWSRVWDGQVWLQGQAAIEHILSIRGASPQLIRDMVREFLPRRPPTAAIPRYRPAAVEPDGLARRIQAYMARLPNLHEGQGRDDVAYRLAAFLVRDLQLSDGAALPWLLQWDQGNRPPKGEERLREIIANARKYGKNAFGMALPRFSLRPQKQARVFCKMFKVHCP